MVDDLRSVVQPRRLLSLLCPEVGLLSPAPAVLTWEGNSSLMLVMIDEDAHKPTKSLTLERRA